MIGFCLQDITWTLWCVISYYICT